VKGKVDLKDANNGIQKLGQLQLNIIYRVISSHQAVMRSFHATCIYSAPNSIPPFSLTQRLTNHAIMIGKY
jgi:hypothetical protein